MQNLKYVGIFMKHGHMRLENLSILLGKKNFSVAMWKYSSLCLNGKISLIKT